MVTTRFTERVYAVVWDRLQTVGRLKPARTHETRAHRGDHPEYVSGARARQARRISHPGARQEKRLGIRRTKSEEPIRRRARAPGESAHGLSGARVGRGRAHPIGRSHSL